MQRIREKLKNAIRKLKNRIKRIGLINIAWTHLHNVKNGHKTYTRILNQYGRDVQIYIEHYPGTGDIYITCSMLECYRKINNVTGPYVVTIIGNASKK